jgi:tRNA dimethylallyltransferase
VRPALLVIGGATATGKTGLAVRIALVLAREGWPAEIISADSRQVYRGLDIGTAKASAAERAAVPHHGLDLVDPDEPFTVADFVAHADGVLDRLSTSGAIAILAGGTGLYLRAVARGLRPDARPRDPGIRAEIDARLARGELDQLATELRALAPGLARSIDIRNPRRLARALEVARLAGDLPPAPPAGYDGPVAWLGLRLPHDLHARRIRERAAAQFAAGLIEEAAGLRARFDPGLPAFTAIGYHEAWAVIDGELSLEDAIELDAHRNLQFARRQRTWFRAEREIEWLDAAAADPLPVALARARGLLGGVRRGRG